MKVIRVAILGFGTIGQGIYSLLNKMSKEYKSKYNIELVVGKIFVEDPTKELIPGTKHLYTNRIEDVLLLNSLQVVFDALNKEEPSFSFLKRAIKYKYHVITSNEVMFARHGSELQRLAKENNVSVGYEATIAGGISILKSINTLLRVNKINHIKGILNGTSNYILSKMHNDGWSFEKAFRDAQLRGYADGNPLNDISGQDALKKLKILSELAFEKQPDWNEAELIGIENISEEKVAEAKKNGFRYRQIAEITRNSSGSVIAKVDTHLINQEHPLYSVDGINNAIIIEADNIGELTYIGPSIGRYQIASIMLEECLEFISVGKDVLV